MTSDDVYFKTEKADEFRAGIRARLPQAGATASHNGHHRRYGVAFRA